MPVLLALASALWLWRDDSRHTVRIELPQAPDVAADRPWPRNEAARHAEAVPGGQVALPETQQPLADQIETLMAQAQAGNPVAACRLYLGLGRCRMMEQRMRRATRMQQSLLQASAPVSQEAIRISSVALAMERLDAAAGWCQGVDTDRWPDAVDAMQKAYARMSVWQRVLLVMSLPDGSLLRLPHHTGGQHGYGGSNDHVYPQILSLHAYSALEQGIATANPLALEGMVLVHSPARWPSIGIHAPRLALPDRSRFARYALLLQRVRGDEALGPAAGHVLTQVMAGYSDDERAWLMQQLEQDARQWLSLEARQEPLPWDEAWNDRPDRLCELEAGP